MAMAYVDGYIIRSQVGYGDYPILGGHIAPRLNSSDVPDEFYKFSFHMSSYTCQKFIWGVGQTFDGGREHGPLT